MVTLTEAIERSPTDCDEGTYIAPSSTNCCRPLQIPFSLCQERHWTLPRVIYLPLVYVKRMAKRLR
jgi:hypothetical protein